MASVNELKQIYQAPATTVAELVSEGIVCHSPGLEDYYKHDYYEE